MSSPRTPIEIMIDNATGYKPDAGPRPLRKSNEYDKGVAASVSNGAIRHIQEMYPNVFKSISKTAKISLRNHIYNNLLEELRHYPEMKEDE